jgi:hypothetical protein
MFWYLTNYFNHVQGLTLLEQVSQYTLKTKVIQKLTETI